MENQFEVTLSKDIENCETKGIKEPAYFYPDMKPETLPQNFDMNFSGIIKGKMIPYKFMNSLCEEINKAFKDNCLIEFSRNELKFDIMFDEGDNSDIEENLDKIEIKLYKSNDEEFVLKFTRISGSLVNFSSKFQAIANLIRNHF